MQNRKGTYPRGRLRSRWEQQLGKMSQRRKEGKNNMGRD
jgi:hypothetical protein